MNPSPSHSYWLNSKPVSVKISYSQKLLKYSIAKKPSYSTKYVNNLEKADKP